MQSKNSTLIDTQKLLAQRDSYHDLLDNNLFFEAHEALEELWFPLRFEKSDEIRLIRAYINAAVSFELVKRGRPKSGLKPWGFFERHAPLIDQAPLEHQKIYQSIYEKIIATQKRLECFMLS